MTGTPATRTAPPAAVPPAAVPLAELTTAARRDGLAAGLCRAFDPALPMPCSAHGYTLLPRGYAARVARWQLPGRVVPADRARVRVTPHPLVASEGLDLLRVILTDPAPGAPPRAVTPPGPYRHLLALVAVRLGVTRRMLDLAVTHLGEREFDGTPLTGSTLVQATIADVGTALETCHHGLPTDPDGTDPDAARAAAAWMHARLDRADASVATMFGAAGYLAGHPVRCLHVVALVRDLWSDPAPGGSGGEG